MSEPVILTADQRETLLRELAREDLSIYTAVRMAREDVSAGRLDEAFARLRIDADKIRMHSRSLYELIARN